MQIQKNYLIHASLDSKRTKSAATKNWVTSCGNRISAARTQDAVALALRYGLIKRPGFANDYSSSTSIDFLQPTQDETVVAYAQVYIGFPRSPYKPLASPGRYVASWTILDPVPTGFLRLADALFWGRMWSLSS